MKRKPNRCRGVWIIVRKDGKREWIKIGRLWRHGEVDINWEKLKELGIVEKD